MTTMHYNYNGDTKMVRFFDTYIILLAIVSAS